MAALLLSACDGSGDDAADAAACPETGAYACLSGETEPLYPFQWALNYAASFFKDFPLVFGGGMDLNVAPVHRQGIKGQGVNVLVLDTGTDLHNPDLRANADFSMSWNFLTKQHDPYPDLAQDPDLLAHGTAVAGMIAAAQNGTGVMGIAPRASLGAANYLSASSEIFAALGGAPWSSKAHVFNASYAADQTAQPYEADVGNDSTQALRSLKQLRDGKGGIFIKGAANSFDSRLCEGPPYYYDCTNPGNDLATLESNAIVVAALNAKGQASSYSSAGSVIWVTGMGGEYGNHGNYGEGATNNDGPAIFSTDVSGCIHGYSTPNAPTAFLRGETQRNGVADNPGCNYNYMNGTSSATPTISGVAALILSANPDLTWRDVRDILRISARKVDADYALRSPIGGDLPYASLFDLSAETRSAQVGGADDIRDGALAVPTELGWQRNAAGYDYANWYGFGVPDAQKAVALAQAYGRDPSRSIKGDVVIPPFRQVAHWQLSNANLPDANDDAGIRVGPFPYRRVTTVGTLAAQAQTVDQFQVRMSGNNVCMGSLGIAVRSPAGTVSLLKLPNDHFKAFELTDVADYALSSIAFHGEAAQGDWEILAIAANPDTQIAFQYEGKAYVSDPCPSTDEQGNPLDFTFSVEARIIAQ